MRNRIQVSSGSLCIEYWSARIHSYLGITCSQNSLTKVWMLLGGGHRLSLTLCLSSLLYMCWLLSISLRWIFFFRSIFSLFLSCFMCSSLLCSWVFSFLVSLSLSFVMWTFPYPKQTKFFKNAFKRTKRDEKSRKSGRV